MTMECEEVKAHQPVSPVDVEIRPHLVKYRTFQMKEISGGHPGIWSDYM